MQFLDFLNGPLDLGRLDHLPRAVAPCGCQLVRPRSIQHFGAARLQRKAAQHDQSFIGDESVELLFKCGKLPWVLLMEPGAAFVDPQSGVAPG